MHPTHAAETGMVVVPDLVGKEPTPSKGYFHSLPDAVNPRWVSIIRTAVPMGIAAFTRRLPTLVPGVHYQVVGTVHADLAPAMLYGLECGNQGVLGAHADALAAAKKACAQSTYIRSVMYDEASGGWWVHLSGARRFMDWRQLGLFSSTVALFTDWSQLAAMQYNPAETDVSDLVTINVAELLSAAGVSCKKLKRPPAWTDNSVAKPYFSRAGSEHATGPANYDTLYEEEDTPYLGEPGQPVQDLGTPATYQPIEREEPTEQLERFANDDSWVKDHPVMSKIVAQQKEAEALAAQQPQRMFWND